MKYLLFTLLILTSISVRAQTKKETFKENLLNLRICGEMMDSVKRYDSLLTSNWKVSDYKEFNHYRGMLYYFWNQFQYYFVIVFGVDMLEEMKIPYNSIEREII